MAVIFEYRAAHEIGEALRALEEAGDDAKLLAGGQSLMPLINLGLAQPSVLVDINQIKELDFIQQRNGSLALGALTRHSTAEHSADVKKLCPLLAEVYPLIGDPQVRNRGTIGGSLAHADPVAELPTVAVCLGAIVKAQGAKGSRDISASDFFVTYLTTGLDPHEMVTEVSFPVVGPRTGSSFMELVRRQGDFAIVAAAASVQLGADGTCSDARLALAGVGPTPLSADTAAAVLKGKTPTEAMLRQVAEAACQGIDPESDVLASADYRRAMAPVYARRALTQAFERAKSG
jgi:CO/xanthine dehydrogenase FAD-binding subunit